VKPIVIHADAQKEIDESFAYYERKRPGLGYDFVAEVEETTQRIQRWPKLSSKFNETDYRRCLVKRFPYLVFYRETDDDIRIIAVAHAKRKPGYWLNRSFDDE
jgi:toxin ParE1/3/4